MKNVYSKLIAVALQLLMAVSVVAISSYAWVVISGNPAVEGIQITIGGGNTILVAADLAEEVDGEIYHYPDVFGDTLNFSRHESYQYLNDLCDLTPVSTWDGLNWFVPDYYDLTDPEVTDGTVLSGTLKAFDDFVLDDTLAYANLESSEAKRAEKGSYLYLDFWVVSPGDDYTLRISTGEDGDGSFVIGLPQALETENGPVLSEDSSGAAACVRAGLLVDPEVIRDNTMVFYQASEAFSQQYTRLKGSYAEPGSEQPPSGQYRFTIYEPNGDAHPYSAPEDGTYVVTQPLGLEDGRVYKMDTRDRLTVQKSSDWLTAENGVGTQIGQRFQAARLEPAYRGLSAEEAARKFYGEYLGGQVSTYVSKGRFIQNTGNLYHATVATGTAGAEYLTEEYTAGATKDAAVVTLERNVPQRVRLFVWLEGQDVDCVNQASASSFAIRIELAGSNTED